MQDRFQTMVGERVKIARKEADLTQEELSDQLGFKDRQILANLEAGKRKLAAEEMMKLMDILKKPMDFFTDPLLLVGEGAISWRAKNTPKILDEYEKKVQGLVAANRRFAQQLGETFNPIFPKLSLHRKSSFEETQAIAEILVDDWKLGSVPAKSLAKVAEEKLRLVLFYVDAPIEISGAACRLQEFNTVLINRNEPSSRRNYNLGHEIFHILTWDAMPPERIDIEYAQPSKAPRIEQLAENFAAALLMPQKVLKPLWTNRGEQKLETWLNHTSEQLCVSSIALYWRLRNLDYLSEGDAMRVNLDHLVSRGGKQIADSKPKLYNESFVRRLHQVLEKGFVSVRRAAQLLDCTIEDLEDLFRDYHMAVPFDL